MDREASFLRCSKLSCYSEFNKMVQVIARVGSTGAGLRETLITSGGTGTSAEYQFYYTLSVMLREIVSNNDPVTQKKDLQRVYSWYSLNKPIIKSKTRQGQRKPVLSLNSPASDVTRMQYAELIRPQTAPAALCQILKPKTSFTSSYITRSILNDLNPTESQPGEPFDQLQIQPEKLKRPKSSESVAQKRPVSKCTGRKVLSVVNFSGSEVFNTRQDPIRPATVPAISCKQLFNMSSGVAANMLIDKEMKAFQENIRRRKILARPSVRSSSPRLLVTSPVERPNELKQQNRSYTSKQMRPASRGQSTSPVTQSHTLQDQLAPNDTMLVRGNSLKSHNSTKEEKSTMEAIQEEQLSATQSLAEEKDNEQSQIDLDLQVGSTSPQKQEYKNTKECEEDRTLVTVGSIEKEITKTSETTKKATDDEITTTEMTATVTLKGQNAVDEQEAATKPTRLAADVRVTTLTFITEDQSSPNSGAQGKKQQGHLHKHSHSSLRSRRPNTVHSFRTNFTNFTTAAK